MQSPQHFLKILIPRWIVVQILGMGYFTLILPIAYWLDGVFLKHLPEILVICIPSLSIAIFLTWAIYQSHVLFWGALTPAELRAEIERERQSPGPFRYHIHGFSVRLRAKRYRIEWDDILEVNLAKRDNYGWDSLYLGIKPANGDPLVVAEDDPGYHYLLEQVYQHFPTADRRAHLEAMACEPGYYVEIYNKSKQDDHGRQV